MLRITDFLRESIGKGVNDRAGSTREKDTPVVVCIWNLTNYCNLSCKHCYSSAKPLTERAYTNGAEVDALTLSEIRAIIPTLYDNGIRCVILSGGEPLLRDDIFDIARELKGAGIMTALSTNGLLINEGLKDEITQCFDYVGVSIDGLPQVHDSFRGLSGAYGRSIDALRMCMDWGLDVGLRFTLSQATYGSLEHIFDIVERQQFPKLYISHLVYSGRGGMLEDLDKATYRSAVTYIIQKTLSYIERDISVKVITGNNDSTAVALLDIVRQRYSTPAYDALYDRLRRWGGNQAAVALVNIGHKGDVKADPFYREVAGNIRQQDFGDIWNNSPFLKQLRQTPRKFKGRCGSCQYIDICNGNSRARAFAIHGDYYAEDPACIL
ncbi:MAG: radical SAM protein [Nitrospirae bacterium]|uniref:radical SAM/SPASM domain-containing protein n=1 Tax=Candidatus Magnetobacterium casense TaxID=1455061 RepID=UPI00058E2768|nr:radical SAM protein [Candidatus Magnetobacterium casensis]MBF0336439.1 radical SAM protein [Nitrospirota bacterium]